MQDRPRRRETRRQPGRDRRCSGSARGYARRRHQDDRRRVGTDGRRARCAGRGAVRGPGQLRGSLDQTEQASTIRAYRNIDERTARELDGTIESLAALLELHAQSVTDDLPCAKHKWLRKVDQEMNTQLRSLLVQLDEHSRQIRRGLHPINSVLQGVPFREGSVLTIETVDRPSTDLKELRDLVTQCTSNTLLQDVSRDAERSKRRSSGCEGSRPPRRSHPLRRGPAAAGVRRLGARGIPRHRDASRWRRNRP